MQTPRENPFALLSLAYVALTGDPFRQPFLEGGALEWGRHWTV
jgi:hypothetical protein